MPPEFCGWISRRIKPLSQEQVDKNSWNYYKQKIQEWITLIELHEASLTRGE
ncbi:nuclease, partial [Escherichia coli]|nr:nuclease [Escherichia coli]